MYQVVSFPVANAFFVICHDIPFIWELGPYGYVRICWISMDIYGYLGYISASSGTYPTCCTGLDIHHGYPYISIHIHAYPSKIFKDIHILYPKSYPCIIHAVIHQGIHTYPYSTLHIHVYSCEISIIDIHTYPYVISMHSPRTYPKSYLLYPFISIYIQFQSKQISIYHIHRYPPIISLHYPCCYPSRYPYISIFHFAYPCVFK